MVYLGAPNPEGWVFRGLCLDSYNRVVRCIYPDPATVQEFSIGLRLNLQYEQLSSVFIGVANQRKFVILWRQSCRISMRGCIFLALEQLFQHMIEQNM